MQMKKTIALMIAAAMMLSACSNAATGENKTSTETTTSVETKPVEKPVEVQEAEEDKTIKDLTLAKVVSSELNTLNMFATQTATDYVVLANLVDGLAETDNRGMLKPCLATSWETKDNGITWTFKLRDGVKWVDVNGNEKASYGAEDHATAMEWILNFHKNNSLNTSNLIEMVAGAKEYYEYTKNLSKEEALKLDGRVGGKFREMVGFTVVDDLTMIYTCTKAIPYFYSLATDQCLYPMAQGMIDEIGVENVTGMSNEQMWYNGCYTLTTYIHGTEKIMTKNPLYWDKDCTLFDTVTHKMVDSNEVAYMMYENGECDFVSLNEAQIKTIYENKDHKFHDYLIEGLPGKRALQMHLNFDKNMPDGSKDVQWNTAVNNEAFRKSMYYGLDFTSYWARFNAIDPIKCENNFYSCANACFTDDGTDYIELVRDKMGLKDSDGKSPARLDKKRAEEYKKQAIDELSAQGVTFPIVIDYYVGAGNQTEIDNGTVLKQVFKDCLGEDYVQLNLCTYVTSFYKEVRDRGTQAFGIFGWGGGYADPSTYLTQEAYNNDNAYFSMNYSHINDVDESTEVVAISKEYTKMLDDAMNILDDNDARLNAFADAEAFFFEHAMTIPIYCPSSWCLSRINLNSQMYSMFGRSDDKMKNWETNSDGYTFDMMEEIYTAKEK